MTERMMKRPPLQTTTMGISTKAPINRGHHFWEESFDAVHFEGFGTNETSLGGAPWRSKLLKWPAGLA